MKTAFVRFFAGLVVLVALMYLNGLLFRALKRIKWIKVRNPNAAAADDSQVMTLRNDSISTVIAYAVFMFLTTIILFVALLIMGIPLAHVMGFIASVGLVVGFASQELFKDIIGGIAIAIGSYFTIGDLVTVSNLRNDQGSVTGVVGSFNVLNTTVVVDQVPITIPNSVMQQSVVHNRSVRKHTPVDLTFGVENSYDGDWNHVVHILDAALTKLKPVYDIEKHAVYVSDATKRDRTLVNCIVWVPRGFASTSSNVGKLRTRLRQTLAAFRIPLSAIA